MDEDGGEAAGHPNTDVEQEDGQEAHELPGQGLLLLHIHPLALSKCKTLDILRMNRVLILGGPWQHWPPEPPPPATPGAGTHCLPFSDITFGFSCVWQVCFIGHPKKRHGFWCRGEELNNCRKCFYHVMSPF